MFIVGKSFFSETLSKLDIKTIFTHLKLFWKEWLVSLPSSTYVFFLVLITKVLWYQPSHPVGGGQQIKVGILLGSRFFSILMCLNTHHVHFTINCFLMRFDYFNMKLGKPSVIISRVPGSKSLSIC